MNSILILGGDDVEKRAAELAAESGDELGLVRATIELTDEKVSGGRIEEEREYGGKTFQVFDEPVFIGSAIAQLAGYADAVVVDNLEMWVRRLGQRFQEGQIELDAEILSLVSVMKAQMSDLVLIGGILGEQLNDQERALLDRVLGSIREHCTRVIE